MSHIFPRHTKSLPPVAVSGQGCYLTDASGKHYLDASGGAAVSCLGHGDRAVIDSVKAQLDQLAYAHTGFFTSEPAESLADLLIANAPKDIDRVYLVSGGSEATEAAIKLARQYFVEKGQPNRGRLIARKQSYHGNTIGALSAGGNEWRRLCLESGGNSPAAFSERFDLRLIRRRGQVSLVQLVARAFPSRRPCASGFGLRRGAPKAASARLQRRAARSVF